jgi:lysophospholipid acyltransferase (LPLAT)-like uncharacterized protein
MSRSKRLLDNPAVRAVVAWLAAGYVRLIRSTTRWTVERPPATDAILAGRRPYIGCFWHGRMIMAAAAMPPGRTVHVLTSGHRDGVLVSRVIAHLGVDTVSGSSRRGGAAALRRLYRLLKQGDVVGITPDGPRGPRMRVKPGVIKAAQLSGMPIVAISGAVGRRRILGSWDRFCLALPFSRGLILWDEPIVVPRTADAAALERLRLHLEQRLNALTAEADRRLGQAAVEPAAAPRAVDHAGA